MNPKTARGPMDKIATAEELQAEIRTIWAMTEEPTPSRSTIARALSDLADKVALGGRSPGRDPYWMTARYPGKAKDGTPIRKGDRVFYYPNTKTMLVGKDAEKASKDFEAGRQDEDTYNYG